MKLRVVYSRRLLRFRKKCSPTFRRRRQSFSYIGNAYPMKTTRCCSFCVWDTPPPPLEFVDSVPSEGSLSRPPEPGIPLLFSCSARNTTPLPDLSKWLSTAASLEAHRTPTDMSGRKTRYLLYMNTVAYPVFLAGGGGGSTNSVEDRGQTERGSGGGSPLVRGSGSSCNLLQELSFHIVKFS